MKASVLLRVLRQFSKKIAQIQTFFILTMLYFIALPFFAFLFKILKGKIYNDRNRWKSWRFKGEAIHDLKKQF